jgi:hypothetical protein
VCGNAQTVPAVHLGPGDGVRYAVLALRGRRERLAAGDAAQVIDQRGCQYVPHVVATTVGATIRLTNSDPHVLHTVLGFYGYHGTERWFDRGTPYPLSATVEVDAEGVHTLVCGASHAWMAAFVHAFAHPYFAVTDEQGEFVIDNVPPGTYPLHFWHEGITPSGRDAAGRPTFGPALEADATVTVEPRGTSEVVFTLTRAGVSVGASALARR